MGNGLIRQYSICNDPSDRTRYRLGVLRETEGRGGSEAAHALEAGQHIQISEPRNHFALSGAALMQSGIVLPLAFPDTLWILDGRAEGDAP